MAELNKKDNILQAVKFALFSASAGIIQVVTFTILNELVMPSLDISNPVALKILSSEYGVNYLIALVLSVLWNFTFNRKFTFKSATNIPKAMLKIFGFYCVFTPISTVLGELISRKTTWEYAEYVILGVTMIINMITEFLFCRFVVYKDSMNTNEAAQKSKKDAVDVTKQ